jgi:hypothetical protein
MRLRACSVIDWPSEELDHAAVKSLATMRLNPGGGGCFMGAWHDRHVCSGHHGPKARSVQHLRTTYAFGLMKRWPCHALIDSM